MNKVVVVGSINMDIVATTKSLPEPGETITGNDISYFPGGKGLNQAVAASRSNANVEIIGAVGLDSNGKALSSFLNENNVATKHLLDTQSSTGTAVIAVDSKGENSIIIIPGANHDVKKDAIENYVFEEKDIVICQLEIPIETVEYTFLKAKQGKAITILNPSPMQPLSQNLIDNTDILMLNEIELGQILNIDFNNSTSVDEIIESAKTIRDIGFAGTLITTLGSKGCIYISENNEVKFYNSLGLKAVDTTGAGDCFTGNFVAQLSKETSIDEAIQFAIVAAGICVTRNGAGVSMPTFEETNNFITKTK